MIPRDTLQDAEYQRYHVELPDGGPMYTETDLTREWLIEPWNATSSLAFLIPALYWMYKIWPQRQQYTVLVVCSVFLILGGLGSTFFHALRIHPFFLVMDVLPMQLLMIVIIAYCWGKILPRPWMGWLVVGINLLVQGFLYTAQLLPSHTTINVGYAITGILFFAPLLYILFKTKMQDSQYLLLGMVLLGLSLFFREVDARENFTPLPMGTHFLWHLSSAWAAHFLARYLYGLVPQRLRTSRLRS